MRTEKHKIKSATFLCWANSSRWEGCVHHFFSFSPSLRRTTCWSSLAPKDTKYIPMCKEDSLHDRIEEEDEEEARCWRIGVFGSSIGSIVRAASE